MLPHPVPLSARGERDDDTSGGGAHFPGVEAQPQRVEGTREVHGGQRCQGVWAVLPGSGCREDLAPGQGAEKATACGSNSDLAPRGPLGSCRATACRGWEAGKAGGIDWDLAQTWSALAVISRPPWPLTLSRPPSMCATTLASAHDSASHTHTLSPALREPIAVDFHALARVDAVQSASPARRSSGRPFSRRLGQNLRPQVAQRYRKPQSQEGHSPSTTISRI